LHNTAPSLVVPVITPPTTGLPRSLWLGSFGCLRRSAQEGSGSSSKKGLSACCWRAGRLGPGNSLTFRWTRHHLVWCAGPPWRQLVCRTPPERRPLWRWTARPTSWRETPCSCHWCRMPHAPLCWCQMRPCSQTTVCGTMRWAGGQQVTSETRVKQGW